MYQRQPLLADKSYFIKLLVLLLIIVTSALFTLFLGVVLALPFFGGNVLESLSGGMQPGNPTYISLMKFFQIVNQLGMFVLPGMLFAWLASRNVSEYLRINRFPALVSAILTVVLIYAMLPVIHGLASLNEAMRLPDFLHGLENWMKQSENAASQLTEAFLSTTTFGGLLLNLFMVGVLAAIGEEILFRGILIRIFRGWFKNIHLAVVVSAILFSAFHLQFYGFLPRLVLGLLFGYLFIWSGSLWLPIIAHFFNNASAVVVYYLVNTGYLQTNADEFGATNSTPVLLISILISAILIVFVYFAERQRKNGHQTEQHINI